MTTIILPWPRKELFPNFRSRSHWPKTRALKAYRRDCGNAAIGQGVRAASAPSLRLLVTFCPPGLYHYDEDNLRASFKAGQDAIADVTGVNDSRFRVEYERGAVVKGGEVRVVITEAAE